MKRNLVLWLIVLISQASCLCAMSSGDTIPPVFLVVPMDTIISCDSENQGEAFLNWYQQDAFSIAVDNGDTVEVEATLEFQEALAILSSSDPTCEPQGLVELGFYALDSCDNSSIDTLFASFSIEDNEQPELTIAPIPRTVVCNSNSQNELESWLLDLAGAELEDNCIDNLSISYVWQDNLGNSGFANINTPVNIPIITDSCDWFVDVNYTASDGCGNANLFSSRFTIEDNQAPGFFPELNDITIGCDITVPDLNIEAVDACLGTVDFNLIEISTQDPDPTNCGHYNYEILKIYSASDVCGNEVTDSLTITVQDNTDPFFLFMDTLEMNCSTFFNNDLDNFIIAYGDNCSEVLVTFGQTDIEVNPCDFEVRRDWVVRDRCNNITAASQAIFVSNENQPILNTIPTDLNIPCNSIPNATSLLQTWLNDLGGASFSTNCSQVFSFAAVPGSYDTLDVNTYPGTPIAGFDESSCNGSGPGLAQSISVDFVFYDECGNTEIYTQTANIIDEEAPVIISACNDTLVFQAAENCNADILLPHPNIIDNCGEVESPKVLTISQDISSSNPGDVTAVVDPLLFRFEGINAADILGGGDVLITVALTNVDADDLTEIFELRDESGIFIRNTPNTSNQCGDTTFVVTTISSGVLSFWASDGIVDLRLVPVGNGVTAINDVCIGSSAAITLSYEIEINTIVELSYSIDGGPFVGAQTGEEIPLNLDVGFYEIEYLFEDCGGNSTGCTQFINIRDQEPPEVICPDDITLDIQNEPTCESAYFFEDIVLSDDCGLAAGDSLKYYVEGATEVELTNISGSNDFVIISGGLNTIYLIALDASGNSDTCSFEIFVRDTIAPVAQCSDVGILAHPATTEDFPITLNDINDSSFDLCDTISYELSHTAISCMYIDSFIQVQMTVTDLSGNTAVCESTISLFSYSLSPLASLGFCEGDTLRLDPNLSDILLGFDYDYEWLGPNGYISTESNPLIPNASAINNGEYILTITGDAGCSASGSVMFDFSDREDIELIADAELYCENEAVLLTAEMIADAQAYNWFEGIPPNGSLITSSAENTISIFPSSGMHDYYVQVDFGICLSFPSNAVSITVQEPPEVEISVPDTLVCSGTSLLLEAVDPVPSYQYEWYGPNGFLLSGTEYLLDNIIVSDGGTYKLVAKDEACVSDTASIIITTIEGLAMPEISGENLYCEGSTITLNANNVASGETFTWLLDGAVFTTTAGSSLILNNATVLFSGEWQVFAKNFNCESDTSDVFEISVEEEIEIGATNNGPGCEGDFVTLTGTFLPGASYTWMTPDNEIFEGQEVQVPAIAGQYVLLVETAAGCGNSTTTEVEVNEAALITALSNSSVACMNLGDSIVFQATVFPPGDYDYEWMGPNGFMSFDSVAVVDNFNLMANGSYSLSVYNGNCPSNTLETTVNALLVPETPSINHVAGDCEGDDIILESSLNIPGVQYVWDTPSGEFTTDIPVLELLNAGLQIDGFYTVSIKQDDCFSEPSEVLEIMLGEMPEDPQIIAPSIICTGDDLEISTNQIAQEYHWSGLIDTISSSAELLIEAPTIGGELSLSLFNGSCQSENSATVNIEVTDIPALPELDLSSISDCVLAGENIELCVNNYNALNTYYLVNGDEQEIVTFETQCLSLASDSLENGVNALSVYAELNGCRSIMTSEFEISAFVDDEGGALIQQGNTVVCDNSELTLDAELVPTGASIVWSSPDPTLSLSPSGNSVLIGNIQDGDNTIILSTSIGECIDVQVDMAIISSLSAITANDDIVQLDPNQSAIIDVINNDNFGQEVSVVIIGAPVVGNAFVDDDQISYIPESGYFGQVSIIYEICEIDCPDFCDRAVLEITVGDENLCMVPTVITPNDDGINDELVIPCLNTNNFPSNNIIIFNQWGDEVFSANPYRNDWSGTYSGDPLPVGTYYYVLDLDDGTRPLNGFFIIQR